MCDCQDNEDWCVAVIYQNYATTSTLSYTGAITDVIDDVTRRYNLSAVVSDDDVSSTMNGKDERG